MSRLGLQVWFGVALILPLFFPIERAKAQSYDPQTESAIERGRQANAAGKYADAVKAYKEANKLQHNGCSVCYRGLAAAYTGMGDMIAADDNSKKALKVAKDAQDSAGAHVGRGIVLMTFASADAKRLPQSEAEFRQALVEAPTDLQARYELGLSLLKQKKDEDGIKELKAVLTTEPNGFLARAAEPLIENPRRAREWFAPAFHATTLQGQTVSLAAMAGKVVVLDFWATWCPPCRASVPELKDLLKKYPREKLVVVSISADEKENEWKDFIAKKNMDWPQVWDSDQHIGDMFNIHAFPTYLIINGEGIVVQKIVGADPQQSVAYRIKDTLKGMKELQ